jgi:hypothetical protein
MQGLPATDSSRRQVFVDNIKIAEGSNGYSLVSSTSTKPVAPRITPKPVAPRITPKPVAPSVTSKNLVTYWSLDSTSHKIVGNLTNGARLTSNEGANFDGIDDYLNLGKLNISGKITLAAWILSDDLSNCSYRDCRIISKATGTAEQEHYIMVSTVRVGEQTRLRFRLKTNGVTSTLIAASGNITENEWIHVAAVYDGITMRLYKDGVEVGSRAKRGSITPNNKASLWIGDNPPNYGTRPWKGNIDDVRIYNYPLTNNKISVLANTNPPSQTMEDVTAPKISNIKTTVTDTTATITWNTNESSSSTIQYGLSNYYGNDKNNSSLITSHKVTLKNLVAGKLYHYQINVEDSNGNNKSSLNHTFTTKENLVKIWSMGMGKGTGTLVNGAQLTSYEGVKFDGYDDYLNIGKLNISGNAITISGWFKSYDLSNCSYRDCRIISKATGTAEQEHYLMVSTIKIGKQTRLRFRLKTNGVTSTLIAAYGNIIENEWTHVTATYDGKAMRLYKDGVEVGNKVNKGSITTAYNVPLWIGGNPSGATSRPWRGHIGNVSIYNYAMTTSQVLELIKY